MAKYNLFLVDEPKVSIKYRKIKTKLSATIYLSDFR